MGLFSYICCMPLCTNNFRNSPGLAFYRIRKVRRIQREYVLLLRNANLNLNCDSTRCILQVFLEVESPQAHLPSASHFYVFFFLSISRSVLLLSAVLIQMKHSSSLSAMFVYIRVSPNNLINARAPSSGPRLSLFSEVSYEAI